MVAYIGVLLNKVDAYKKIGSESLKERLPSDGKVSRIYRRHLTAEFNTQITSTVLTSTIANVEQSTLNLIITP